MYLATKNEITQDLPVDTNVDQILFLGILIHTPKINVTSDLG